MFELPSVHMRERTSLSIPERGEGAWLVSVLFWHADCYFIWENWDRISVLKCKYFNLSIKFNVIDVCFFNFPSVAAEPCGPVAHPLFLLCGHGPHTFGMYIVNVENKLWELRKKCVGAPPRSTTIFRTGPPTFKIVPPPLSCFPSSS